MSLPPIIALCGHPGAGKTEAQKILFNLFGYVPVDDGLPLRRIAMNWLGATEEQVSTPAGKASAIEINGRPWIMRDVLGEIGNAFEEKFGGDVIPLMAFNQYRIGTSLSRARHCFASVRRQQGWFYKRRGGVVIEVRRPGVGPSAYEFDRFDPAAVDAVVDNDGTLLDLCDRLSTVLQSLEAGRTAASQD